jgi:hypothetical protein
LAAAFDLTSAFLAGVFVFFVLEFFVPVGAGAGAAAGMAGAGAAAGMAGAGAAAGMAGPGAAAGMAGAGAAEMAGPLSFGHREMP